jgi:hypothetical protein
MPPAPAANQADQQAGSEAAKEAASECIICWEAPRGTVLIPCGHLGLCRTCADGLMAAPQPLCPVCRAAVSFAQAVYTA